MKLITMLSIAAAMQSARTEIGYGKIQWPSSNWKPKFTAAELKLVRSLPKRERKQKVKELRAKYWETERKAA